MVKKTTFLNKIVNRFRSTGVDVSTDPADSRSTPPSRRTQVRTSEARSRSSQGTSRVQPEAMPAVAPPTAKSSRKITSQEEAAVAMNESFSEFAGLLRGLQQRLDNQGQDISRLPEHGSAQLEVLRGLATQLEKQNQMSASVMKSLGDLPEAVGALRETLAKVSATEERTVGTLDDFKQTMDRIQGSMGEMVKDSRSQADAATTLAQNQENNAERLAENLESSTQQGLKALRWAQEDQSTRMIKMVGESGRWNKAVVVMLVLVFVALSAIFVAIVAN